MRPLVLLLFLSIFPSISTSQSEYSDDSFISAVISETGLDFIKDLLVEQELKALTPLQLSVDIKKSISVPLIGSVQATVSNITLYSVNVSSSIVSVGGTGVVIAVSGATANLSFDWKYSYSTWFLPVSISDEGSAYVEVEGMDVGLIMTMKNKNGTLQLIVMECVCIMDDLSITLDGGASWFYQGFIYAFGNQIRSAVETAITGKINEGTSKLDSLLQSLPKEIDVDHNAALNVTFVEDPLFGESSIEFDINGLFIPSEKALLANYLHKNSKFSDSCLETSSMLGLSLDENVFNSASMVYFQEGLMHWLVDKVPDQSLLNTAKWKYIVPQLYKKYPNDEMQLNLTFTSAPVISIKPQGLGGTITTDMTVNVLDSGEVIPVACIAVVISVSGVVKVTENNLAGEAELHDFTLDLKWSKVGNFHMFLIEKTMQIFLNTVFVPIINSHLRKGFPLPIVHGFTLQNAYILNLSSKMIVCSDVVFNNSAAAAHFML